MRATLVVERDVPTDELLRLGGRLVRAQIYLLVLDRTPEPLHEDVVAPSAFAVHAHFYAASLEGGDEVAIGELSTLIRIEDLGASVLGNCLLDGIDAEVGREAVGKTPGQNLARRPIEDSAEVKEALAHRDV